MVAAFDGGEYRLKAAHHRVRQSLLGVLGYLGVLLPERVHVAAPDGGRGNTGLADTGLANTGLTNTVLVNTGLVNTGLVNTGLARTGLVNAGLKRSHCSITSGLH